MYSFNLNIAFFKFGNDLRGCAKHPQFVCHTLLPCSYKLQPQENTEMENFFLQFGTSEYQFNFMYPVSHNLLTTRYSTYFTKVCRLLKNWFPCGVNGGRQVDVPKFPQCILQICYCFYPICMSTWRLYWRSSKWNMFKT